MYQIGHFIHGKHVPGTSGRTANVFNPATGEVQAQVALAGDADLQAAIDSALSAQPKWAATNPQRRARVFMKFVDLLNQHMDELTFVHSLHTEGVAHGPATLFLHCGSTQFIRPSMGSWILYGLGSENENLPGFVSIAPSPGNGGPRNFGNAFLPAIYQGTAVGKAGGSDSVVACGE